jgi:glycosyltransferase involved in cell wall biosynthesis
MRVLVIPTTDWIRHPNPNRLNFIFDILAERNEIFVLHLMLERFKDNPPRDTKCKLVDSGGTQDMDQSVYYLLSAPAHLKSIRKTVKEEKIDVILSTNILPSFLANFAGVPVVFDYLDHLEESASVYYPDSMAGKVVKDGVSRITRYNLLHAQSVITVTGELKSYLHGVGVKDVHIIPNGVDTKLLRPMQKDAAKASLGLSGPVLGYVGALEYWVDLETVVRALPSIDATLLVVGPGLFTDYGEMIQSLAKSLGVSNKVVFTGRIPYSMLGQYISAMDIGLNPLKKMKKNEYAAGGKVFNYLSCGRPVLSSRMISLERLLGASIYYYDDELTLADQATRLLSAPGSEEGYRKIALQYDWRSLAKSYEAVLKGVL